MNAQDKYCVTVCKGKCCYIRPGKACRHLANDYRCSIHHLWNEGWCNHREKEFFTMPIETALAHGLIKPEIEKQCCYAHPELLEVLNGR